jgi:hypothetical protein
MTIANIKSNTLRRTLLVIAIPLLPVIITCIALVSAADAFIEECKDQLYQGGSRFSDLWEAVCYCWKGHK